MSLERPVNSADSSAMQDESWPRPAYAWYMTLLLMVLYMFSFLDRTIIVLLIEPIKADLSLTDTQVSLLYGFAFAIFYTLLGIPIARLADRKNRRTIVALGLLTWSAMTALCGLAKNFGQLFTARIGVGVGEAALSPAAYSLISDSFPEEKRAKAMSVYSMGVYLGAGVALLAGGAIIDAIEKLGRITLPVVGELFSWQLTFIAVGAPGLLLFLLVIALREPARKGSRGQEGVPLREALGWFSQRRKFFLSFYLAMSCLTMYSYSLTAWTPSFFIRTFDWSTLEISRYYGAVMLAFGPAGVLAGGWLASARAMRGDKIANPRMAVVAFACLIIPAAIMTTTGSPWTSLAMVAIIKFFTGLPTGVAMAAAYDLTPNYLRAQAAAIYLFLLNIIGLGMGPTLVALITDYVFADPAALRYSIAIVGVSACIVGLLLSLLAVHAYGELRNAESSNGKD